VIDGAIQRTVVNGQVELAAVEGGDPAGETLVFLHGYPDTKELWEPILALLAPDHHLISYDLRGAGASSAPRGPAAYDLQRLGDDLAAVIDALAPGRRVHLVGHDWGGIQGWEFVAEPRFEDRIASFTTIAGPSLEQVGEELRSQLRQGHLLRLAGQLRRSWYVVALCTPGVPTLVWRGVLGRGWWARLLVHGERVRLSSGYPVPGLAATGVHLANIYRRNILWRATRGHLGPTRGPARTRVPVQLIVPAADHFISPSYYARAADRAPQLRRRAVPGSHWAPRAQPELLAGWIAEFARDVRDGKPI
jgi:pimeloyl-ACP methyl ester carboxylesterase